MTPEDFLTEHPSIAVIDDDQPVRDSLRRLLKSLGYSVATFASAAEFLASPAMPETGCLIADVQMPGMTGIELYGHLTAAGHEIPTILVTAYPEDAARARALRDGVICYMGKPLDEDDLMQCLRSALGRSASHDRDS